MEKNGKIVDHQAGVHALTPSLTFRVTVSVWGALCLASPLGLTARELCGRRSPVEGLTDGLPAYGGERGWVMVKEAEVTLYIDRCSAEIELQVRRILRVPLPLVLKSTEWTCSERMWLVFWTLCGLDNYIWVFKNIWNFWNVLAERSETCRIYKRKKSATFETSKCLGLLHLVDSKVDIWLM